MEQCMNKGTNKEAKEQGNEIVNDRVVVRRNKRTNERIKD